MPAKRPSDFETKPMIQDKSPFEKRKEVIEKNLLSDTTDQIGVVTYLEKEKKHIPSLHLKPDEQMYDDMMAIMELLGMKNNKTMTIRMALSNYRQQLERERNSR
ncbi:hypothetical protein HMPREF2991_03220 [Streptococcus sp. HMSC072D07]|jgi:hypothetical protein|uniref:hypothetical protein n=1 Tax=Streptococcus sp. HMSC072D07 TaxID=1739495 RepID=UPI0008A1C302|nr:hypothetical protein [Streptococcus sp. HMSC072D07]OFP34390.1 hypothetical protein HMPREF2991_03220 [Streptococcus sp. HMSC072D07]